MRRLWKQTRAEEEDKNETMMKIKRKEERTGEQWWLNVKFGALRPESCRFESHPSRRVGTLGKSFTHIFACSTLAC